MDTERKNKIRKFLDVAILAVTRASMAAGPEIEDNVRLHIFLGNSIEDLNSAKREIENEKV